MHFLWGVSIPEPGMPRGLGIPAKPLASQDPGLRCSMYTGMKNWQLHPSIPTSPIPEIDSCGHPLIVPIYLLYVLVCRFLLSGGSQSPYALKPFHEGFRTDRKRCTCKWKNRERERGAITIIILLVVIVIKSQETLQGVVHCEPKILMS